MPLLLLLLLPPLPPVPRLLPVPLPLLPVLPLPPIPPRFASSPVRLPLLPGLVQPLLQVPLLLLLPLQLLLLLTSFCSCKCRFNHSWHQQNVAKRASMAAHLAAMSDRGAPASPTLCPESGKVLQPLARRWFIDALSARSAPEGTGPADALPVRSFDPTPMDITGRSCDCRRPWGSCRSKWVLLSLGGSRFGFGTGTTYA